MPEDALQIAEKRIEVKSKGEREYAKLNAEYQRISRRGKEAFLSINAKKQRKTTERERPEISSRKLDTKGMFHAIMDTIKDRRGIDLNEAEDIKKRWQEYTEKLYKKGLNN